MAKKTRHFRFRIGTAFITIGLLLIVGALGLAGYNYWDGLRAEKASLEIVDGLLEIIEENKEDSKIHGGAGDSEEGIADPYAPVKAEDPDRVMEIMKKDGYNYIGVVTIPSLGLSLPIMEEWDYSRLKISPCRFSGSYYANDLVIAGHNYARHFSPIKWIKPGSDVYFTNPLGVEYHYQVDYLETLSPSQVEEMTTGDWDLTLFTCNTGGSTRCAVRCSRVYE